MGSGASGPHRAKSRVAPSFNKSILPLGASTPSPGIPVLKFPENYVVAGQISAVDAETLLSEISPSDPFRELNIQRTMRALGLFKVDSLRVEDVEAIATLLVRYEWLLTALERLDKNNDRRLTLSAFIEALDFLKLDVSGSELQFNTLCSSCGICTLEAACMYFAQTTM